MPIGVYERTDKCNEAHHVKWPEEAKQHHVGTLGKKFKMKDTNNMKGGNNLSTNRYYICDFYLPNTKEWIELKGQTKYIRQHLKKKYEKLLMDYPKINWKIISAVSLIWDID
jgi:hypothetical protein